MKNTNSNRALQKTKGKAIKGLKAWIKALEMQEGSRKSQGKYRYEIAEDGSTARIFTAADQATVEGTEKPLSEWAAVGVPARHALIGLRHTKESLEQQGPRVLYTLNVLTGEANISRDGTVLEDQPTTIEEWAKLGQEIEKREFDSLKAAKDYAHQGAVDFVLNNMVRWGIIRQLPTENDLPQAS